MSGASLGRKVVRQDLKPVPFNDGYLRQVDEMPEDEWEAYVASVLGPTKKTP